MRSLQDSGWSFPVQDPVDAKTRDRQQACWIKRDRK